MIVLPRHGHQYQESPLLTPPSGGSSERVDFALMCSKPTVTLPNFPAFLPPDSPVCHLSVRILLKRQISLFPRSASL